MNPYLKAAKKLDGYPDRALWECLDNPDLYYFQEMFDTTTALYAYARDASGKSLAYAKENATCFCVVGAFDRARRQGAPDFRILAAKTRLLTCLPKGFSNLTYFNDALGRTKEEVLALFDKALEGKMK